MDDGGAPAGLREPAAGTSAGLARFVAAAMAERELTLAAVADRAGLAVATVAALRAGTRGKRPRPETLEKLAHGLGVPREHVLAAASMPDRSPAAAREAELLTHFRRLAPADQLVATRLLGELARSRAALAGPAGRI